MRQSKFTETQIVSILKEADAGRPVNEIWRNYGISSAAGSTTRSAHTVRWGIGHRPQIPAPSSRSACRREGT
jgi:hypothetical protein